MASTQWLMGYGGLHCACVLKMWAELAELANYDALSVWMWTSEDKTPELGHITDF